MTGPLRIVHFLPQACGPDASDGVLKAVFQLSSAQRALGHDVFLADRLLASLPDTLATRVKTRLRRLSCTLPATVTGQIADRWPDIVHLHSVHVPENVAVATSLRRAGIPYCVTTHGGLSPAARAQRRLRKAAFAWIWERRFFDNACFVHALTPAEESDIRACGVRSPVLVVPNGIDPAFIAEAVDPHALRREHPALERRRVFMYVGRLEPVQKGLDTLITAFAAAGAPNAALVLVGPDSKKGLARLTALINHLGVSGAVTILGAASGERLANLMAGADVFVHPSRWEGLSLSVLEAAATRKPCLLTHAADPAGVLGPVSGAVIVDGSVRALADAVLMMTAMDRADLDAMGARARSTVLSRFALRTTASAIITGYASVAEARHVARRAGGTVTRSHVMEGT